LALCRCIERTRHLHEWVSFGDELIEIDTIDGHRDSPRVRVVHPPHHGKRQPLAASGGRRKRRRVLRRNSAERDPTTRPAGRDRDLNGGVGSRHLDDDVDAAPTRRIHYRGGAAFGRERHISSDAQGRGPAMFEGFDDEHSRCAAPTGHLASKHADGSGAHHQHVGPRTHVTESDRMDRDAERLEQRAGVVAESVREREQQVIRPEELLLQRPVQCAVTGESHCRTQVVIPSPAPFAGLAGDGRVDGDATARIRAGQRDGRELVSRHDGALDPVLADAAVGEPMQVRTADPHRRHREARPTRRRLTRVRFVGDAQVADGVQTGSDH
jgi:hypothetical protein